MHLKKPEDPTTAAGAQETSGSWERTVEGQRELLRSQFCSFPDQQLRAMLQCRHPSGACPRFGRHDTEQSIAGRFQQQAVCFPDRLAVRTGADSLTYAELNEAANHVAWQLLAAAPGVTRVGVFLSHGLPAALGYLAVMKAGKVCVLLDPAGQPERARAVLGDAGLRCVISDERGLELLRELGVGPRQIVTIESCRGQPGADPDLEIHPTAPADITYSSGSTGLPKGVVHSHRNRLHNAWNLANALQVCPHDRVTLLHSSTSGAAYIEIHLALLNGAALCTFDVNRLDMSALAGWLVDSSITVVHWVPSLFRHFATGLRAEDSFPGVRLVMLGSELATTHDLDLVRRHFSESCGFVHRLGSVESLNMRLYFTHGRADLPAGGLPAGYQLPDQELILVDERGRPVPAGATGEVVICSDWLALEYFGRPELTAAAFFTSPADGRRCYRTGDLGRLEEDGCLKYLGRADGRIKVRGNWVDAAQIEALLAGQPGVAECAVVGREDERKGTRLTAFLVPAAGAALSVSGLRSFLLRSLPPDALPSRFLTLARLPRTANGKLDRHLLSRGTPAALREACGAEDELRETATFVRAGSDLERCLTDIWEEVLDTSSLGIHDSFFDLGGDSLLALRIMVRVNQRLGCELSPASLISAPTIAQLARAVTRAQTVVGASRPAPAVPGPRTSGQPLPLSFGQERLWFLEQMEGPLTAYNLPYAWRLCGPLDTEALRRALEALVRRHEQLRTTFALVEGEPVQVPGAPGRLELPLEDLRGLAAEQRDAEVDQRCEAEAERPFDLARDRMLRASLLRLADDEHVLLVTLHHIACDGWSLQVVFWRELALLYNACCREADAGLPDLALQYAEYAVWQRQQLAGERLTELLQYWRAQLAGVNALQLPTDRPRPARLSYRGARHDFGLGPGLIGQLQSLGRAESATLQMTLLAAFQALLSRYGGQDDVAVGTPIAGRSHAALEHLIGFFVNTLVLRTDLAGDPTFRELLGRVRRVSLAAYDHQDLPFEKLVEELQPQRHLSRSPLVGVLFQLQSFSDQGLTLPGLEVSGLPQLGGRVRFDLEMHLWQEPNSVRGAVVYSTDLFDPPTIARMVGHFVTLLDGVAASPDRPVRQLPLLTEPERRQLLVEWNDTAVEYPRDKCVHQLFEEQVEQTPGAVAVVFEGRELTYRELNARANQLAHHLRSLGAGPETLVGVCLERSLELVIGILGILKAGGAYVPLDADGPHQRLQLMLGDAKIEILVTQQPLLGRLPVTGCRVVCVDGDAVKLQELARSNPSPNVGADNLAYVMFTSGSTGQPKGVAIRHAAIARLVFGNDYATFGPDRVFLQLAPVSFDASTFELWGALLHGAKLVIAPAGLPDFRQLESLLKAHRVTTLWLTTALFHQVVEDYPQALKGVEELLTGGEVLSVPHICKAQAALGGNLQLVNCYGPTESTTFATCYQIPSHLALEVESMPIGRPIGNTQVYVLDEYRAPVPIGVAGELYIGGAGLARGYLNRPELTAERFVAHPSDDAAQARLYRTGDLCRWRADGNLEFLGRLDDQVKLRGFRVELGEVEAALRQHPSVAHAAALLREDRPGDKRLVAYCVPAAGAAPDAADLARHLRARLPAYMVPSALVLLRQLPLTPGGKVDRRALPAPDHARPQVKTDYVAPRSLIEHQLASIWRELLAVDRVGADDDFFELGGHSLLAVRLFARIETAFGRKLPLAALFQHGTIAHLASLLAQSGPATEVAIVMPLQPGGDGRTLFLMPSIGGELLFSRALIEELGKRFPVMGIQPTLDARNLEPFRTFRTTARCFVSVLRAYQPHGPYALAGFSYGGLMAFEVACVLSELGETVDPLAVIDTGPGRRGLPPQLGDRWRRLSRIAANLPSWLRKECRQFSASRLAGSAARKLRRLYRLLVSGGRSDVQLDDAFDVSRIPSQNRELMRAIFAAFRDYVPQPYAGRLTLFRANTRPLLADNPYDLGWGRYVRAVDVRPSDGDHETLLHPPHVGELARQLAELLLGGTESGRCCAGHAATGPAGESPARAGG
jgi:amino acid adenylation domain-containing protein